VPCGWFHQAIVVDPIIPYQVVRSSNATFGSGQFVAVDHARAARSGSLCRVPLFQRHQAPKALLSYGVFRVEQAIPRAP